MYSCHCNFGHRCTLHKVQPLWHSGSKFEGAKFKMLLCAEKVKFASDLEGCSISAATEREELASFRYRGKIYFRGRALNSSGRTTD
jgi:hypothetical protein